MPRILIGDFAGIARLGLREFLEEQGFDVVGEQAGMNGFIERLTEARPSVVVVDLDTIGGMDIATRIATDFPAVKVIACSSEQPIMRVFPPFGRGESYASELTLTSLAETVRSSADDY